MAKPVDEKSLSAKERIVSAYLDILKEKPYNKITVAEVVYNADVNRSTFYRNFVDIFDLYDKIVDDFVDELFKAFVSSPERYGDYQRFNSLGYDEEKLRKYKETVLLLSGKNGSKRLLEKFSLKYISMLDEAAKAKGHFDSETEFMHRFITYGGVGTFMLKGFIEERMDYSKAYELSTILFDEIIKKNSEAVK